jgi:hypothetical protein
MTVNPFIRKIAIPSLVLLVFGLGFVAGRLWKPAASSFHDMIVSHPHDLSALITPKDKRVAALAAELQTPENAFVYVRDVIGDDPSLSALPAGDIIEEKKASCLGKAILLCSLYRAMEIPHEDIRIVTGEVEYPYGIVDHVWVELELYGICLQQDTTNLIGHFAFDQFRDADYTRTFIRREGYAFNDVDFAVVSRLNQLKGMGHPPVD